MFFSSSFQITRPGSTDRWTLSQLESLIPNSSSFKLAFCFTEANFDMAKAWHEARKTEQNGKLNKSFQISNFPYPEL